MNVDYLVKNQTLAEKFGIKSKLSQKIFNHKNIISLTPLKRQEINGVRHYYIDEDNLFTAHEVLMKLTKEPFIMENTDKIMISIIPDIESVNYGRGVGYEVIHHAPPADVELISGTKIRKGYMDTNGDVIEYAIS